MTISTVFSMKNVSDNFVLPAFFFCLMLLLPALASCSGTTSLSGGTSDDGSANHTATPATAYAGAAPEASAATQATVAEEDYQRAEQLLSRNISDKVLHSNNRPRWIDDDRFWYRTRTTDGYRFFRVDPDAVRREKAFDHDQLAESLSQYPDMDVEAGDLPFSTFRYIDNESAIRFEADGQILECDLVQYHCEESDVPQQPDDSILSPDERWAAFIHDHNLWIRDMETGEDFALTTSGEPGYGFATNSQGWSRSDTPVLHWSPDSRKIATYRLDERDVKQMHLLETAQDRAILESWPYALPGDTVVPMHERIVLDVEDRSKIWLDVDPSHQRTSNCCGLQRDGQWADISWSADASQMAFVKTSRDYRQVDLYIADTETGDVRHVYRERAETFFESNLTSRGIPNWRVLFERDQFIWFSRRDEWGHLFLHRLSDGQQSGRITSGEWNVVDLLHVDEQQGEIFFTAAGKTAGRDPYLRHLYRVNFGNAHYDDGGINDGGQDSGSLPVNGPGNAATETQDGSAKDKEQDMGVESRAREMEEHDAGINIPDPVLISPQEADHEISVSPSGRYFVDEYSGFRQPSVTLVRSADGSEVMTLEEADITPLRETVWTKPEPFKVKARDGETDLYGLMFKPSDFDPAKSYPVVVNIYPGPQTGSVGTRSFSASRRGQVQALAEIGFIVIQLDALGTPLRSKSFHTAWYGNMSDNGIEDQIAALQQLAGRHEWLDTERAGIYGHSGGGYATMSALLRFPGVFKAGVASAGNMDNRGYTYYWGEKYQGQRKVKDNEDNGKDTFKNQAIWKKADRLEDRLLVSYGTMDSNVHPNMTLLLIDELIEENKDFDLIVMPNRGHGYANEPYHVRRTWDFFVRHLLRTDPPEQFELN